MRDAFSGFHLYIIGSPINPARDNLYAVPRQQTRTILNLQIVMIETIIRRSAISEDLIRPDVYGVSYKFLIVEVRLEIH